MPSMLMKIQHANVILYLWWNKADRKKGTAVKKKEASGRMKLRDSIILGCCSFFAAHSWYLLGT